MNASTSSVAFSTGFGDPIFFNSNQHSEKTDAFGIGVSLLMGLLGEPANELLTKLEDAFAEFWQEREDAAVAELASRALTVTG